MRSFFLNSHFKLLCLFLLGSFVIQSASASYVLNLPEVGVDAGQNVTVDLNLDNAAGVAGVYIQLNFNPEILNFVSVNATSGLGAEFDIDSEEDDGRLFIYFTTTDAEEEASGSGTICSLTFQMNPGAVQDLYSELTMAEVTITNEMGISLSWENAVSADNGKILCGLLPTPVEAIATLAAEIGAIGADLLPDGDADGDSINNLIEYALGGDLRTPDSNPTAVLPEAEQFPSSIRFHFRRDRSDLFYYVETSETLSTWAKDESLPASDVPANEYVDILMGTKVFIRLRVSDEEDL